MLTMVWLVLMGLLLGGYFVLGGYDYGSQLLYPLVGWDEGGRRVVRAALGPFFFGNEVWLVAFVGVLFGAFPVLEGTLLSALYPLLVVLLLGLVVGKAAVQLRGRAGRGWDVPFVLGGLVPAAGWGLVVGVLLHGVSPRAGGGFALSWSDVLDPFVALAGVTNVALVGAHGAAYLAMRTRGEVAVRARRVARPLLVAAVAGVAVTVALAGDAAVTRPVPALLLAAAIVAALLVALAATARGRAVVAFAATSAAVLLPVPLLGVGLHPFLLASSLAGRPGMTAAEGAADVETLAALLPFGLVLVPVILAYQLWSWWLFRGRVGDRTPSYF